MNESKRGSPFEFPQSFIDFAAFFEDSFQLTKQTILGCFEPIVAMYA